MRNKNQQGAKRASKAEQLYQESWKIPSDMEGQHSLSEFVYASATAARVDVHDDPSNVAGVFGSGPPPPLPPKQKQQLARTTGRPLSQQFGPDEPIYAPVPLNRRKAGGPGPSASPSRGLMTKRHSVETQTEVGVQQVPVGAAGYAARRHSETPTRGFLREQNSGGVPQKTHEK